jgi:hypothetical protein
VNFVTFYWLLAVQMLIDWLNALAFYLHWLFMFVANVIGSKSIKMQTAKLSAQTQKYLSPIGSLQLVDDVSQ